MEGPCPGASLPGRGSWFCQGLFNAPSAIKLLGCRGCAGCVAALGTGQLVPSCLSLGPDAGQGGSSRCNVNSLLGVRPARCSLGVGA